MRPEQHLPVSQPWKSLMVDRMQPHMLQPLHLQTVMNDIRLAIQRIRISQLPLSALYGGDNPKTESGIFIYLDFYHIYNIINKQALTVFLIFNHKKL